MKKTFFSLLFLLFSVSGIFAQLPENRMKWQETPLTWNDFSGVPDLHNDFDASTNSGISYSWSLRSSETKAELFYKVRSYFYPDLSWVKPGKDSALLLAHEQLHFDISELHARKLRKIMDGYVPDLKSDVKEVLERIYEKNENARRQMQEKYDRETRHGQDEAAQEKWEIFIRSKLAEHEEYSS
ncbi:protein of unknown function [Salinimicrobium catena]|uniref:DUF922 domain-containing protein n=1 Tax=Salinimicrobium catena TaxID=390640 RepID=A0A1H5NX59_9FLAO|nr:DUF922 domain-containing protein [Salinimicrobium catena]SDL60788.1 protein of unknown function [Salinimicrobium catena]SEF05421.1 protein of unknown function [Salinimicrobium catena]